MENQKIINNYTSIKLAMEELGFKSRTSINQKAEKGEIRFVTFCPGTTSETRMFLKSDIKKLKKQRGKA